MAAVDIIAVRAPEYSTYPGLNSFIAIANSQTGAFDSTPLDATGTLGTTRDMAVALRALHLMCRSKYRDGGFSGGQISFEREGELDKKFTVDPALIKKYPDLVTTIWGLELVEMIKSCFGFVGMTRQISPDASICLNNTTTTTQVTVIQVDETQYTPIVTFTENSGLVTLDSTQYKALIWVPPNDNDNLFVTISPVSEGLTILVKNLAEHSRIIIGDGSLLPGSIKLAAYMNGRWDFLS